MGHDFTYINSKKKKKQLSYGNLPTSINASQGSLKTNKQQKIKRIPGKSTDINKKNS